MLEIVFLGTGASVPSGKRHLSAIWMQYSGEQGESMLFDCGEGTQLQLMKARLSFMKISRIFITHWHADHWAGLVGLIQTMNLEGRKQQLTIYGPEAERFMEGIMELGYWAPRFPVRAVDVPFEGDGGVVYSGADYDILATPTRHSVPSVAYCFREKDKINVDIKKAERLYGLKQGRFIGKLKAQGTITFRGATIRLDDVAVVKHGLTVVYTGDTLPCNAVETLSQGADVLIHDSTFEDEMETVMHTAAEGAAKLAKRAGVKHLILTHFSRRYQDITLMEKKASAVFPHTLAARDFMRISVKKGLFKIDR